MTLNEANNLLILGGLPALYRGLPVGISLKQIFLDCISYNQGADLDSMIEKCIGLHRRTAFYMWSGMIPAETDAEFRLRAEQYSSILDTYSPPGNSYFPNVHMIEVEVPTICYHSWKPYQGIYERYDYCEFCDEKRNK